MQQVAITMDYRYPAWAGATISWSRSVSSPAVPIITLPGITLPGFASGYVALSRLNVYSFWTPEKVGHAHPGSKV
jgi:hypothetical protein